MLYKCTSGGAAPARCKLTGDVEPLAKEGPTADQKQDSIPFMLSLTATRHRDVQGRADALQPPACTLLSVHVERPVILQPACDSSTTSAAAAAPASPAAKPHNQLLQYPHLLHPAVPLSPKQASNSKSRAPAAPMSIAAGICPYTSCYPHLLHPAVALRLQSAQQDLKPHHLLLGHPQVQLATYPCRT
jgi:hypothetical protein